MAWNMHLLEYAVKSIHQCFMVTPRKKSRWTRHGPDSQKIPTGFHANARFDLKGRRIPAQGNALGLGDIPFKRSEGTPHPG
jgi:hypothetical protein